MRMRARWLPHGVLTALALFGCDDSSGAAGLAPPPTMIVIDPAQFDDAVSCVDDPGGMRLYVATLFDVSSEAEDTAPSLPSSPPSSCTSQVGFGYVEPGRKYRAEIDGYEQSDLEPLTPGNRLLRRSDSSELVAPRWRASCGNPEPDAGADAGTNLGFLTGPAQAFLNASVTVMGCTPFSDSTSDAQRTAIRVDLSAALGELRCGPSPGQVWSYSVQQQGSDEPPIEAACDGPAVFDDLTAGETYFFAVSAFERPTQARDAGAEAGADADSVVLDAAGAADTDAAAAAPRWSTSCYQRALAGVERSAVCEPLRSAR